MKTKQLAHTLVLVTFWFVFDAAFSGCGGLRLSRPLRSTSDDWPTFARLGTRIGSTPDLIQPPLKLVFEYDVTAGVGNGSPLIVDSMLIVGNLRGELYVINAFTNKRVGWVNLGDAIQGSPVVDGSVVFVALSNSRESLVAFDLLDGRAKWKREYGDLEVSPLLHNNMLYVGNTAGVFSCVDRNDGELMWRFEIPDNTKLKGIRSSAAAEGALVFFGADDGNVYALDAATGSSRWKFPTYAGVVATPVIHDSAVFVGNTRGFFHAIDMRSGILRWKTDTGSPIYSSASVANNVALIGNAAGNLAALRIDDGSLVWQTNLEGVINSAGVVSGDTYYVGTLKKEVFGVRLTDGSISWKHEVSGRVKTSPAVAAGILFVATDERNVLGFRGETQ